VRERHGQCLICRYATRQGWLLDGWRCLECGSPADGEEEEGTLWVVLSSPSAERSGDSWVEGVFSRADKAVEYMRGRGATDYFWAERHRLDDPI